MRRSTGKNEPPPLVGKVLTALFWIAVWQLLAVIVNQQLFVASPLSVAATLLRLLPEAGFRQAVTNTSRHIVSGFLLSFASGVLLACLSARLSMLGKLVKPLVSVINSTPVASFTILALLLVGSKYISVLMAFLMALPVVYNSLYGALTGIDRQMFEAADLFGMPGWMKARYIIIPEVLPPVIAAGRSGFGISWKAGVAAEVIGIASKSIGGALYGAKVTLDTAELFAYTLVVILLSFLCEQLFTRLLRLIGDLLEK